jgi:putative heme iron utilization protein
MEMDENAQEQANQKYKKLVQDQQTLLLSTVSIQGDPECSYAPYVRDEKGLFYIFVSELASHAQNMLQTPRASIMFIQNEKNANNIFARERVIFNCSINEILQQYEKYPVYLDRMSDELGETMSLLRSLPDFHLLQLTPDRGRFIAGFGQAFNIDINDDKLEF